jgi:acyl carrier protein
MSEELNSICGVIREIGKLESLEVDQDIYEAGFSSVRALDLLLELEDRFGIAIPDDRFVGVRTARGLHLLLHELRQVPRS